MKYKESELSIDSGNPIELYKFTYLDQVYTYTSAQFNQVIEVGDVSITFFSEYIRRGDELKLGLNESTESCTVEVLRTNPVALLYQGAPPEREEVKVEIFRIHGENSSDFIKILEGSISQVRFIGSIAEITVNIENILNRIIPCGKLSYYCQNCLYDNNCKVDFTKYELNCRLTGRRGLIFYADELKEIEDGYFTYGVFNMGNAFRQIKFHRDNSIVLKYPISEVDLKATFKVWAGCNGLFHVCAKKFNNTENFSGVPYIQPYNAFINPTIKGAYWIRDDLIWRDTQGRINEG